MYYDDFIKYPENLSCILEELGCIRVVHKLIITQLVNETLFIRTLCISVLLFSGSNKHTKKEPSVVQKKNSFCCHFLYIVYLVQKYIGHENILKLDSLLGDSARVSMPSTKVLEHTFQMIGSIGLKIVIFCTFWTKSILKIHFQTISSLCS